MYFRDLYEEEFQQEYNAAAGCGHFEKAEVKPRGDNADDQRVDAGLRTLGGVDDGRKSHHRQRDIRHIIEKRF